MVNNNFMKLGVESNWMSEILKFSVCEYMGVGLMNIGYFPPFFSLFNILFFTAWGKKIIPGGNLSFWIFEKN
jgi:hypothetical protein